MKDKEIMNRKEVADYLGISISHLRSFQNEIKQIKLGRSVRFRKQDVDEYIENKIKDDKNLKRRNL